MRRERSNSFFFETSTGLNRPRAIFVDTDPSTRGHVDDISESLDPDDILTYKQDCRSNFFEGRAQSSEFSVVPDTMDRVRRHVERCDNLGGFLVFRSIGGGTGSGVGTCVLEQLQSYFKRQTVIEPMIYPSDASSVCAVEPFNAIFSLAGSASLVSLSLMLDNQAAFRICKSRRNVVHPDFNDMNRLIAEMISGVTASLRLRSTLNASLDEIVTNIVPEPVFRYATVSLSPISGFSKRSSVSSTRELVTNLLDPVSCLCDSFPGRIRDRYFAASILCQGKSVAVVDVQKTINALKINDRIRTIPWVPNSFKVGVVNQGGGENDNSAVMVGNSTSVRALFLRQYRKFLELMFNRSFVWQFLEAGAEMDDFLEAKEKVRNIIDEYQRVLETAEDDLEEAQMRVVRDAR